MFQPLATVAACHLTLFGCCLRGDVRHLIWASCKMFPIFQPSCCKEDYLIFRQELMDLREKVYMAPLTLPHTLQWRFSQCGFTHCTTFHHPVADSTHTSIRRSHHSPSVKYPSSFEGTYTSAPRAKAPAASSQYHI
jgi:hypothetical protein